MLLQTILMKHLFKLIVQIIIITLAQIILMKYLFKMVIQNIS